jgi:hypothetical protein
VPVLAGMLGLAVLPAAQATAAVQQPQTAGSSTTVGSVLSSPTAPAAAGDAYVPVKPAILASGIWVRAGAPGAVTVRGRGGVPIAGTAGAGVKAVVLQVEVSGASSAGRLIAYSGTAAQPAATSLAYPRAVAVSQLVVVPFATGRQVKLALSAGKAKLAVGVVGYYAAPGTSARGLGFAPVRPERVATVGIKRGATGTVRVGWIDGIPASNVSAVVAEVSAVDPTAAGTLTVYRAGGAKPALPSVAFAAGAGSTGLVIVPPSSDGKFAIADSGGAAKVTVDVLGYYPGYGVGTVVFVPVTATKIGGAALTAGKPQSVRVTGTTVVTAAGAKAVLLSITASGAAKAATVSAYQAGVKAPVVSALSVGKGGTATGVIPVQPGSDGRVTLAINAGSAEVTVAEIGYYRAAPAVPSVTGLHATAVTSSSTTLAWTDPAGQERIVIRRVTGAAAPTSTSGVEVASLMAGATGYTDTGLKSSTKYGYGVFAVDSTGDAARPATLAVTTPPLSGPCTDNFTGAVSSDWSNAANWSTGKVPGAADWACIPAVAGHLPATIGFSPVTIKGFTDDGGLTVNSSKDGSYATELTLTDGTLPSTSSATLTLDGSLSAAGPVTVTGTLVLITGQLTVPETLTIAPLGKLQAPTQGPGGGGKLPFQIAAGNLVTDGTGTIGAQVSLNVLSGASFTTRGGVAADATSEINVAAGGALTDEAGLTAGGLVIQSGATLTIARDSSLLITGNSDFAAGSTLYDSGPLTINALLKVDSDQLTGQLSVDANGTLELGPGVTVNAASNAFNGGGRLLLVAQATGNFGQLVSLGNGKPAKATLSLYAPLWTPACGTTVTALSAGSMLSGFAAVVAADLAPSSATWQLEQTGTTAGATLACA